MSEKDNYKTLINFLENDPDWEKSLTKLPYAIKAKRHPTLPLVLLKYSQFDSDFSNPIVRCCRGSVLEVIYNKVKIVQAPFFKFCNVGEGKGEDIIRFPAYAEDKVDGSLIKFSKYNRKPLWTTSGSFDFYHECPDQWDAEGEPETIGITTFGGLVDYVLKRDGSDWIDNVPEGWTLCFELLSPRNRVICKYPKTELVLTGARDPQMNEAFPQLVKEMFSIPYRLVERYTVENMNDVKKLLEQQYQDGSKREGLVIVDECWNRVKVKSENYLKLKHVKGEENWNDKRIFDAVNSGQWDDIVAAFPQLKGRIDIMRNKLAELRFQIQKDVETGLENFERLGNQKLYAEWVQNRTDHRIRRYCLYRKSTELELNSYEDLQDLLSAYGL
jgi:hypothetical protein